MLQTPLKEGYYNVEGWMKSLLGHYGVTKKLLPEDVLEDAVDMLVCAIYAVSEIYGNFPEIVYNALGQTVDPLFAPDEYYTKIYTPLKKAGIDENRPGLVEYAEGLLTIRQLFQRDEAFYKEHFAYDISETPGASDVEKYEKFSKVIQDITRVHVNQVRKMIAERKA